MLTASPQQPKPKIKIQPKISTRELLPQQQDVSTKAPQSLKPVIKIKEKFPHPPHPSQTSHHSHPLNPSSTPPPQSTDEDSSTSMELSVDDASTASEDTTYIMPVYGVNMRVSLDNKHIYDMDFNLVGNVLDNKSIEWID